MEISDTEKKYIYPAVVIIIFILIIVLLIIWIPRHKGVIEQNISKFSLTENYDEYQKENYHILLEKILKTSAFDTLYEKIDKNWIESQNLKSKDDVRRYLFENNYITSNEINIVSDELYFSKEMYVFKYVIENTKGERKNVIINEEKPNIYTISFEQFSINSLSNKKYSYTFEEVTYNVNTEYVDNNLIQYEIEIINNSENKYEWVMNNPLGVILEVSDFEGFSAANMTTFANSDIFINKGESFKFKVNFNISLDKQSFIKDIKFEDVYKNGIKSGVVIELKGSDTQ